MSRSPLLQTFHTLAFRYVRAIEHHENVSATARRPETVETAFAKKQDVQVLVEEHLLLAKPLPGAGGRG